MKLILPCTTGARRIRERDTERAALRCVAPLRLRLVDDLDDVGPRDYTPRLVPHARMGVVVAFPTGHAQAVPTHGDCA